MVGINECPEPQHDQAVGGNGVGAPCRDLADRCELGGLNLIEYITKSAKKGVGSHSDLLPDRKGFTVKTRKRGKQISPLSFQAGLLACRHPLNRLLAAK